MNSQKGRSSFFAAAVVSHPPIRAVPGVNGAVRRMNEEDRKLALIDPWCCHCCKSSGDAAGTMSKTVNRMPSVDWR